MIPFGVVHVPAQMSQAVETDEQTLTVEQLCEMYQRSQRCTLLDPMMRMPDDVRALMAQIMGSWGPCEAPAVARYEIRCPDHGAMCYWVCKAHERHLRDTTPEWLQCRQGHNMTIRKL